MREIRIPAEAGKENGHPLIELDHVDVTWQSSRQARDLYQNLCVHFQQGELYTIMGPSGCGKSTLLNLIAGFIRPTYGHVRVCGRDLSEMTRLQICEYRNREIGFIFQSFNLIYSYTVLENVMTPLLIAGCPVREASERAKEQLSRLGLAEKYSARPVHLSGGEQQRAAIARALICDPAIILADEPTGNLDRHSAQLVMEELKKIHRGGKTILLVTHDSEIGQCGTVLLQMEKLKNPGSMPGQSKSGSGE